MRLNPVFYTVVFYLLLGMSSSIFSQSEMQIQLKNALTFYASFDKGLKADFALGEAIVYSAASYETRDASQEGNQITSVKLIENQGQFGNALHFEKKSKEVLFFQAEDNLEYSADGFSGTISLWLSLDPEQDLEPGYCDPIQITDVGYNDAALWVDFSDKNPRLFRMGVFGDLEVWNPENISPDKNPVFNDRLVVARDRPFGSGLWTHVVIVYKNMNQDDSRASFYVNGKYQGEKTIGEPFTWQASKAKIFLGLNYVGLIDEVSIFNRPLNVDEVNLIYDAEEKIGDMLFVD